MNNNIFSSLQFLSAIETPSCSLPSFFAFYFSRRQPFGHGSSRPPHSSLPSILSHIVDGVFGGTSSTTTERTSCHHRRGCGHRDRDVLDLIPHGGGGGGGGRGTTSSSSPLSLSLSSSSPSPSHRPPRRRLLFLTRPPWPVQGCVVVVVCGKCDRTGGNLCIRPAIATGNEGRHNNGRRSLFFLLRCCLPLQEEEGGNVFVGHDSPAPCVPIVVNRWMEGDGVHH